MKSKQPTLVGKRIIAPWPGQPNKNLDFTIYATVEDATQLDMFYNILASMWKQGEVQVFDYANADKKKVIN